MDSGSLLNIVRDHYFKLGLKNNPESDAIINTQIRSACIELAQETVWECLLEEVSGTLTTSSTFIIDKPCQPHMVFMAGTDNNPNWIRVLSTEFDFGYASQQRGMYTYNPTSYRRRYQVNKLHTDKNETQLQILGYKTAPETSMKVLFYPLIPAVAQYTENFIPYLLNSVILKTMMYFREKAPAFNYQIVEKMMADQLFGLKKIEGRIELQKKKKIKTLSEIEFINSGFSDLMFYGNYGSTIY